jgi:hypothetical protein
MSKCGVVLGTRTSLPEGDDSSFQPAPYQSQSVQRFVPILTALIQAENLQRTCLSRALNMVPFGSQLKEIGKTWLSAMRSSVPFPAYIGRPDNRRQPYTGQIEARNFEKLGCDGFILTVRIQNLEDYYQIGKDHRTSNQVE